MSQDVPSLIVGVPKESFPGERRVALVPASLASLKKAGIDVVVESGAGTAAGFSDDQYTAQGARVVDDRASVCSTANVIAQVRTAGANLAAWPADLEQLRDGQTLIGMCDPLGHPEPMSKLAERNVVCLALELLPRITRAQSMDVLSSMANIAGYKAVLLAAEMLPRMFPMMMTAAGTITPAKVLVVGAGVAGLQAIATARRLGGVVWAYDIRPAVKEEVQSLGGKFVELDLETEAGQSGGYAKAMDEEFYRKQRELMAKFVADSDVVITTAAVPGKKAPVLITAEMVAGMSAGSLIVDLAAEQGGNCELTKAGETVDVNGVSIAGVVNLPATVPYHASQMYAKNVSTFLLNLVDAGQLRFNLEDEIVRETLVTQGGAVVQPRVREQLGLEPLAEAASSGDPAKTDEAANSDEAADSADSTDAASAAEGDETNDA